MHRFAIGVHLFGVLVVASGVAALIRALSSSGPRHALLIFALLIMLRPAFLERQAHGMDARGAPRCRGLHESPH